jgi:type IV secretory pathway TrbF-like protein
MGAPVVWRAMLRTLVLTPKTAEAMRNNPIGLYIDELHWDKVGG